MLVDYVRAEETQSSFCQKVPLDKHISVASVFLQTRAPQLVRLPRRDFSVFARTIFHQIMDTGAMP